MRNGPKTEKMGQRTKSTRPGPPHTGRPHNRVNLEESKHDTLACHTSVFLPSLSLVQFRKGLF
ncbi:hypothetical protein F383_00764 [Gossypium arboreum]|uniref:Uncharacterized protein n=1 Tax=Gossypium arboreum TaxID=29729 RepID=A0A0B0PKL4_GOSAR|nr:hypothetical protein F383_00764 [Gossypium arboreum]